MTSMKRSQDQGAGDWSEDSCPSGDEIARRKQQPAKRPRLAGSEIGSSVGPLADKVVRATASFLGREGSGAVTEYGNPDQGQRIDAAPIVDQVVPVDAVSNVDARDAVDSISTVTTDGPVGVHPIFVQIDTVYAGSNVDAHDAVDTNLTVEPRKTANGPAGLEPCKTADAPEDVDLNVEEIDGADPASNVDGCDMVDTNLTVDPCRTDMDPIIDQIDPVKATSNIYARDEIGTNLSLDLRKTDDAPLDVDPHDEPAYASSEPATRAPAPITFRTLSYNRNQKTHLLAVGNPSLTEKEEAGAAVNRAGQVSDDANAAAEDRHEQQHQQPQFKQRPVRTRRTSRKHGRGDALGKKSEQEPENVDSGGGAYASGRPMKSLVPVDKRRGTQDGPLRIADADALRHTLGFLRARDLARFAVTSTAAREVAFTHAALEIADRFPTLRLGVLKLPNPMASPLRLAFRSSSTSATAAAAAPADNVNPVAIPPTLAANHPVGVGNPNSPHSWHQQRCQHHGGIQHSALSDQEMFVSPDGTSPTGSPVDSPVNRGTRSSTMAASACGLRGNSGSSGGGSTAGWRRQGTGSWKGAGLAHYWGNNLKLAVPSLHYLELCGDLLLSQQKTMPRLDLIRELQSRTVLGTSEFLTPQMRAMLVDWMVEVAFQFRLSTVALHAAVSALDVCLSKVSVSRYILQLLGVVCTMIQSQDGGGCKTMSTIDAIDICASQYNPSQVYSTFNIVVSNTQEATSRTVPSTAVEILNRMLSCMGEVSGLTRNLSVAWEKQDEPVKEENVLAGLLMDLSLLDQYMFRFRPGTLAAAGLFFARVTALYYSKEELWVTPFLVVSKNDREILRLYEPGVCRPFIPLNPDLEKRPFGAPGLEQFVASQPSEAMAVRRCVERLWLLHQDLLKHVAGQQSPYPVLFRHEGLFKGIKQKFVPPGSTRLLAYNRLGLVPKADLTRMLDKHMPSTAALAARVSGDNNHGTRSVAPTTAAPFSGGSGNRNGVGICGSNGSSSGH